MVQLLFQNLNCLQRWAAPTTSATCTRPPKKSSAYARTKSKKAKTRSNRTRTSWKVSNKKMKFLSAKLENRHKRRRKKLLKGRASGVWRRIWLLRDGSWMISRVRPRLRDSSTTNCSREPMNFQRFPPAYPTMTIQ